jgi:hypothetical protein
MGRPGIRVGGAGCNTGRCGGRARGVGGDGGNGAGGGGHEGRADKGTKGGGDKGGGGNAGDGHDGGGGNDGGSVGGDGGEGGIMLAVTPSSLSNTVMYSPVQDKLPGTHPMSSCATACTLISSTELFAVWSPHTLVSAPFSG